MIDVFIDELNLGALGFDGAEPEHTGRPAHHSSTLFKIYIYGYLNRIRSSRRLGAKRQLTRISEPELSRMDGGEPKAIGLLRDALTPAIVPPVH